MNQRGVNSKFKGVPATPLPSKRTAKEGKPKKPTTKAVHVEKDHPPSPRRKAKASNVKREFYKEPPLPVRYLPSLKKKTREGSLTLFHEPKPKVGEHALRRGRRPQPHVHRQAGDPLATKRLDPLFNWKAWMADRKRLHGRLCTTLDRDPQCLVMNTEDLHEKKRKICLIEGAYEYKTFDKYRGDPKFWNVPNYMYDRRTKLPVNCPVSDKFNRLDPFRNDPPVMDYSGVPTEVRLEKGLGSSPCFMPPVHPCDYFADRKLMLKDNIELIEKFKPDLDKLVVVGKALYDPLVEDIDIGPGNEEKADKTGREDGKECKKQLWNVSQVDSKNFTIDQFDVFMPLIKVNGKLFLLTSAENSDYKFFDLTLRFQNCETDKLYRKEMHFENVGNVAVRYRWEKKCHSKNPDLPFRYINVVRKRFFFPPTKSVLLPGQKVTMPFFFRSREPGVFEELWHLVTDPPFANHQVVKFKFRAFAQRRNTSNFQERVEKYIDGHILQTLKTKQSRSVEHEKDKIERKIYYPNLFTDEDIFLHNNKRYYYNHDLVRLLEKINDDLTGLPWDYNVDKLRSSILDSRIELNLKREHLQTLFEVSTALLQPHINIRTLELEPFNCVRQILCCAINQMENDACRLKEALKFPVPVRVADDRSMSRSSSQLLLAEATKRLSQSLNVLGTEPRSARPSVSLIPTSDEKLRQSQRMSVINPREPPKSGTSSKQSSLERVIMVPSLTGEELDEIKKRFRNELYFKTYHRLCCAIDNITSALDSYNIFIKKKLENSKMLEKM